MDCVRKLSEKITCNITAYFFRLRFLIGYRENYNLLEDSKGVFRICISKKDRQHNGQKKMYKRTNNDLQNIHVKLQIE